MSEVYILHIERDLTDAEYSELERCVSPEKRQKLRGFIRRADTFRGILGDSLTRYAINLKTGIARENQKFSYNDYGKPMLADNPGVHFNLSHSGSYVVCAVDERPIGIDVEEKKQIDLRIAERFFSETEKKYVFENSAQARFFEIWTKKESYIKREGGGLSLTSFDFFSADNAFFHRVFEYPNAVCHVCTYCDTAPVCKIVSLDTLLA